jgi:7-cyano-7-deazaguanine synthase
VLFSGGLDSTVLLAEEASRAAAAGADVQPIYVSAGLAWEPAEREVVAALLAHPAFARTIRAPVPLGIDMTDVYTAAHWAMRGSPPGYHTPDEAVYLPGRNIVLLSKAAVYCAAAGIGRLAIGTLDHNPFPDATPEFRAAIARAFSLGLAHPISVDAPYAQIGKAEVIRRGTALGVPLDLTLSCMSPAPPARHCGMCSKCRERHLAFLEAAIDDTTDYISRENL